MYGDVLNLRNVRVLDVKDEQDYLVTAELDFVPEWDRCLKCGVVGELYRHGKRRQRILDTPMHGKRTAIDLHRQRFRCRACKETFLHPLPQPDIAEDHSMTVRLLEYIQKHSLVEPFTHVANAVGTSEATVRRLFADYVTELERTTVPDTPRVMGIDEIHVAHGARCIFTNIEERTIIELLPDRLQSSVIAFLNQLPGPGAVQIVAIDMWRPYYRAVSEVLPDARVVVDKFHVLALVSNAMEEIRKDIRKTLTARQRRGLRRDQWILRKRARALEDDDRFIAESWTGAYPQLAAAYALKEAFFDIFEPDRERAEAEAMFEAWKASLPSDLKLFQAVARSVENWREPIFTYFDTKVTNAFTESMNALIRMSDRLGRGYTFDVIRARTIFHPRAQVWRPHQFGLGQRVAEDRGGYGGTAAGYTPYPFHINGQYVGTSLSTLMELIEKGEF